MKYPNAAEVIIKVLEQHGVRYMFGIPGGAIVNLNTALYHNRTIKPIVTKNEAGAAYMADGYARITGGLGVCFSTAGPGASNLITGIATSYMDNIPVIALTGQVATTLFGKGAFQDSAEEGVNIVNIFKNFTKSSRMVLNPSRIHYGIQKMIRIALSNPSGPCHLSLPADMMKKEISDPIPTPPEIGEKLFDRESVRKTASLLLSARKPVIFAGWGCSLSKSAEELMELAQLLNIPVATSPKGKGIFPESHPLSLGVFGFAGSPVAEAYLSQNDIDVLMAVGTDLGEMATAGWTGKLSPSEHLIHINVDSEKIGRNYHTSVGVVGDAKTILREVTFAVKREAGAGYHEKFLKREFDCSDLNGFKARYASPEPEHTGDLYHPRDLIRDIQESFSENTAYFVEIGAVMAWAIRYMVMDIPYSFFMSFGFGGMGYASAAVVGGKLGAMDSTDRPVVSLSGDGGFLMTGLEIVTAVEYDIPAIWIIFNNAMHGMIYHGMRSLNPPAPEGIASRFSKRVDFAKTAEGLGAIGVKIEKKGGLTRELVQDVIRKNQPALFDIWIDDEAVPPFGSRIRTVDKPFIIRD